MFRISTLCWEETCLRQPHVQASVLALRQGSQWDPRLLSAFPIGFRAELEQGWEGGETALAHLHTARSCREHGCRTTLPHWQGLRNVSTGAQVWPGLLAAAPSPSELCPAWLCTPKSWWGSSECPIHPAVLAAQWYGSLGRNYGGECAGCFLSFPHEHQQLAMWDARLWGTLGFVLLLPLLLEWEMEAVAGEEVGRSSHCGAGQAPQLPNPGAQRVGQSPDAGACTVPENHLHICLQLLCPPWICPPKAVWGDASVLLPAQTFSPLLGRDGSSPGNLHNSWLAGEGQP